jgi:hypothetical protein
MHQNLSTSLRKKSLNLGFTHNIINCIFVNPFVMNRIARQAAQPAGIFFRFRMENMTDGKQRQAGGNI